MGAAFIGMGWQGSSSVAGCGLRVAGRSASGINIRTSLDDDVLKILNRVVD